MRLRLKKSPDFFFWINLCREADRPPVVNVKIEQLGNYKRPTLRNPP